MKRAEERERETKESESKQAKAGRVGRPSHSTLTPFLHLHLLPLAHTRFSKALEHWSRRKGGRREVASLRVCVATVRLLWDF